MKTKIKTSKRPNVIGIVILSFVAAIPHIVFGLAVLRYVLTYPGEPVNFPGTGPGDYLLIPVAVLQVVVAALLLAYKRFGLILGLIVYGFNLIWFFATLNDGPPPQVMLVNIALNIAVLYYLYVYLTREPQKTFFS